MQTDAIDLAKQLPGSLQQQLQDTRDDARRLQQEAADREDRERQQAFDREPRQTEAATVREDRIFAQFNIFMEKSRSDLMQIADLREKSARLELQLEQAKAAGAAATASSAAHHTATLDTPRTTPGDPTALPNVSNVTVDAFQPARPVRTVTTAVVLNLFSAAVATANCACTADELIF